MKKYINILDKYFEPTLIVLAVTLITFLIFTDVVLRIFNTSLSWAGELSQYLFVWTIYLGISYCIKDRRHLQVHFFVNMLPPTLRSMSYILADIIFLVYSICIVYFGYLVTITAVSRGQISPALEVSIAVLYSAVFIGAGLSVIRLLFSINDHIKSYGHDKPYRPRIL